MIVETLDQNKALNPKAAIGNAVAVPRWWGKLDAAIKDTNLASIPIRTGRTQHTCLDGTREGRATTSAGEESEETQENYGNRAFAVFIGC